jgi:hypothetical protein
VTAPTSSARRIIAKDHFRKHSPEYDSKAAIVDPASGRPLQEVNSTRQDINNSFRDPSIWRLAQLLHGKGLHGNARRVENRCILHASVMGRISTDQSYGGRRRDWLCTAAASSDEAIASTLARSTSGTTIDSGPFSGRSSMRPHVEDVPVGAILIPNPVTLSLTALYSQSTSFANFENVPHARPSSAREDSSHSISVHWASSATAPSRSPSGNRGGVGMARWSV